MSKIKKTDLLQLVQEQAEMIAELSAMVELNKMSIIKLENEREKPQLKQLDQSAFDHPYATDRFKYVALNADGQAVFFESKPVISNCLDIWVVHTGSVMPMLKGYDASNWQNSLIERDTAKELEVNLSSELTGSELCKAMINRGDKIVLCIVRDYEHEDDTYYDAITHCSDDYFESSLSYWRYAVPINNQGEPLTAAEAGL